VSRLEGDAGRPARRAVVAGSPLFILLIAAILSMAAMTIDINLPAIPATAAAFGVGETLAQHSVSVFFAGFALGQVIYGAVADRFGRRPVMLVGLGAFVATCIGCALSPTIEILIGMRFLQGLTAACGPILGRAMIRDRFEGEEMARVMSFAMAAFITAPIIAPSIGAVVLELGSWRWIFVFLAVYGGALWLLGAVHLEESLPEPDPAATRPSRIAAAYPAFFRAPLSRLYGGVLVLTFSVLIVYLVSAAPLFITDLGLSPRGFGIVFAVIAGCAAAGSLLNARLVRRVRLERLIVGALAGATLAIGGGVGLAALGRAGTVTLVVVFGLFFFCFSLVVSNATALAMQPHGRRIGAATSVLGVMQSLIPAVIASLVVVASAGRALPTLAAMLALAVLALALACVGAARAR
jgi:MFS transporter, DHA1 family, multidrug resistance protein